MRRYVGLNLPHLGGQGVQEAEQLVFRLHALPVHNVNPPEFQQILFGVGNAHAQPRQLHARVRQRPWRVVHAVWPGFLDLRFYGAFLICEDRFLIVNEAPEI